MRVRWALEEVGQPYEIRLVSLRAKKEPAHLRLHGDFSAGDLMMVSVLLRIRPSGLLDEFPNLAAYVARGEARPAYERAVAAQWAINAGAG
jgi:glutathione S-transferase